MIIPATEEKINKSKEDKNELIFSYLTLRNMIGFGGMLLPIVLAFLPSRKSGFYNIEPSISDYYFTDRGDILVVMLCIIGTFLITYTGYTTKEKILTTIAGICGIGVAFVPTKMDCSECALSVHTDHGGVFKTLAGTGWHFAFAATFLFCLAIMSLVYFTKSKDSGEHKIAGKRTQKGKRNMVYRICGWTIIASLLILGVYFIIRPDLNNFPIVYVFETVAVEAFGFSWIVKGQTLWPDSESYIVKTFKSM